MRIATNVSDPMGLGVIGSVGEGVTGAFVGEGVTGAGVGLTVGDLVPIIGARVGLGVTGAGVTGAGVGGGVVGEGVTGAFVGPGVGFGVGKAKSMLRSSTPIPIELLAETKSQTARKYSPEATLTVMVLESTAEFVFPSRAPAIK